jgi:hypothetical protein
MALRIIAEKSIEDRMAAALAKLALEKKTEPRGYIVEVNRAAGYVFIARRDTIESAESDRIGDAFQVLMDVTL